MRKSARPTGLSRSVACLALLSMTACGGPTATQAPISSHPTMQPFTQQPFAQQPVTQQPVTQQPTVATGPNAYAGQRFGQARSLLDRAITDVKDGRTSEAVALLDQAKASFLDDAKQVSATDPNIVALRAKLDSGLDAIRSAGTNTREVASILTQQLKDAFDEVARRQQAGQNSQAPQAVQTP